MRNAYKTDYDIDLIDNYEIEGIYGAALDIKKAKVTLDNCYFKYNLANYNSFSSEFVYGGAISNLGDLTILNTIFDTMGESPLCLGMPNFSVKSFSI